MGDIVVKVPKELENVLTPRALRKIELEVLREIEERIQRAQRFIVLAERSELEEKDAEELSRAMKERLAKRYGVL
ncbi:hypothetical protein CL1_1289 [Thermococcus cleftensis]|uniref:Uncharacterized protein n=1 Tax=Thermococcus cleftensis (strain DSM 27260 / KACC 17922 / CL1) TaxID=163003 RepID=I3ZUV4_THECF|nr:hypothetical protein [Thermococcus cleftensis]AFL95488.1 hypothetical protein CL1_1289 [Thermococcus cleftensis]